MASEDGVLVVCVVQVVHWYQEAAGAHRDGQTGKKAHTDAGMAHTWSLSFCLCLHTYT